MKKGLAFILSIFMMLSVAACGAESSGQEENETFGDSTQAVTWLESIGMTGESAGAGNGETAITITIGDIVLDGVIYDTALAQEIKEYFPDRKSVV